MTEYVLDASVAAKWFLDDERRVREAVKYLLLMLGEEIQFHAPTILMYELGNVLAGAARSNRGRVDRSLSARAFETFLQYPILYHELTPPALVETMNLANLWACSFYDSCYLRLAQYLNCRMLTDDLRFAGRLPKEIFRNHVRLLTDE